MWCTGYNMKYPSTNQLRHKITLYSLSQTLDEYGQTSLTNTQYRALVPAKVVIKNSREDGMNDKRVSTYEYEFIVRYNQPVTSDMIIQYENRLFSITGVEDKEGTRKMKTIKAFYNEDNQGVIE